MVQVHLPASPIKHMLVLGTHLKYDKAVFLALQAIFGLNYTNSLKVCSLVGVSPKTRLDKLRITQLDDLIRVCREEVNTSLQRACLLYTSPSPRDRQKSRMPSSA